MVQRLQAITRGKMPIHRKLDLEAEGLGWLVDGSFLGRLDDDEREVVLAHASWRDFGDGDILIEENTPGGDVHLIVAGQAVVLGPDDDDKIHVLARVGPGHLVGERAHLRHDLTRARVEAASPLRTLHIDAEAFRTLLEQSSTLRDYVADVVALREQSQRIFELFLRDPILRALNRDDHERVLQCGRLVRAGAGERIVSSGELSTHVYFVIRGRVAVYSPPRDDRARELLSANGPGWLFGHAALLLELPRTADIEATEQTELLQLSGRAFMDLIARNPPLQRRLYQHLASLDLRAGDAKATAHKPLVVALWSARRAIGTTTLAYGVAAVMREQGPVVLIDAAVELSASTLGCEVRRTTRGGIGIVELVAPASWREGGVQSKRVHPIEVMRAADAADTPALVETIEAAAGPNTAILIVDQRAQTLESGTVAAAETLVYLRWAHDRSAPLAISRGDFQVDAVRLQDTADIPLATSRNAVRIPNDPTTGARFWREGRLELLTDPANALGRASHRMVRVLRGKTVGVALGGGGALGFAHIGLLRALHEADVPIDYVAGVSFGSLVGAVYASGGLELCEELIRQRSKLKYYVAGGMVSLAPLARWVDGLTGGQPLCTTEVPFFPVALDVWSGREVVLTRGTVAEGMRASSSFPGVFPAFRRGVERLVDGGIVNNVPASVVWDAGASFIVASNIIPPFPEGRAPVLGRGLRARFESQTVARLDDILRSVFFLMSQTGRDRATLADYVFDLQVEGYNIYDFHRGEEIYQAGLRQARASISDIIYMRETDRSIGLGQR